MTSKLVVNTIEADTGISSVSFASSISMNSTAKFHFSAAGIDIGADTNINRPEAGVLGFNVNGAEKVRIDTNGNANITGVTTAGVSNLHDVGLTLSGGQIDVGSNIKLGTAGVITASDFKKADGSSVGAATQVTIGVRSGTAVTFAATGSSFNVVGRSGNIPISI